MSKTRYDLLLDWMREHFISFQALGEQLGMTAAGARRHCASQIMPVAHHARMLALGFPVELLPEPRDAQHGRPKLTPIFSGLSQTIHADGQV